MCDLVETEEGDFYCTTCGEYVEEPCEYAGYEDSYHDEER